MRLPGLLRGSEKSAEMKSRRMVGDVNWIPMERDEEADALSQGDTLGVQY